MGTLVRELRNHQGFEEDPKETPLEKEWLGYLRPGAWASAEVGLCGTPVPVSFLGLSMVPSWSH